jgi:hypothetical protein
LSVAFVGKRAESPGENIWSDEHFCVAAELAVYFTGHMPLLT